MDCTEERATRVVVNPSDPALDDALVARLAWWHTSAHPDWPASTFDPAGRLDASTIERMGSAGAVASWATRQRAKALHVGTYEAAIHNMLRRMHDQPEGHAQFYLYRVHLRPDVVVSPGCGPELVDFMGDVSLDDACPPGIDVTRYVNEHEDPGGISLALGRQAIASVQRLSIPPIPTSHPDWWGGAVSKLRHVAMLPVPDFPEPRNWRERMASHEQVSPVAATQRDILDQVAEHLPVNIRHKVAWAAEQWPASEAEAWCDYLAGLVDLVDHPDHAVSSVRAEPVIYVGAPDER